MFSRRPGRALLAPLWRRRVERSAKTPHLASRAGTHSSLPVFKKKTAGPLHGQHPSQRQLVGAARRNWYGERAFATHSWQNEFSSQRRTTLGAYSRTRSLSAKLSASTQRSNPCMRMMPPAAMLRTNNRPPMRSISTAAGIGCMGYFQRRERATSRSVAVTSASRRSAVWISWIREIVLPGVQSLSKRCSAATRFRFSSRTAALAFAKSGVVGSIERK